MIPIVTVLCAKITLIGVDLIAFMGGMFVPICILLRNGIRSFILPFDGFEPFSGTSCSDPDHFKRLKTIVEFCSLIVALLILNFLWRT
jgi:hypothetical protein